MLEVAALAVLALLLLALPGIAFGGRAGASGPLYALSILPCLAAAGAGLAVLAGAPGGDSGVARKGGFHGGEGIGQGQLRGGLHEADFGGHGVHAASFWYWA